MSSIILTKRVSSLIPTPSAGKIAFFIDDAGIPKAKNEAGAIATLQGPTGLDGNTVLSGAGVPSNALGVNGNFYINTSLSTIYGPKAAGVWGSATSLIGPTGPTGATGSSTQFLNFSLNGAFVVTTYLVAGPHQTTGASTFRFSGNVVGFTNADPAPHFVPTARTISAAAIAVRGVCIGPNTPAATVNLALDIYSMGMTTEGSLLGTLTFPIASGTNTIGTANNTNAATNFKGALSSLSISVPAQTWLACKFVVANQSDKPSGFNNLYIAVTLT